MHAQRFATFSPCRAYRYWLESRWRSEAPLVGFCMLNPSTADEVRNDPTVERCERRARRWGYGGFVVVNVFALRSTDPKVLYRAADPVGPDNDAAIEAAFASVELFIAAWGTHGSHRNRDKAVRALLGPERWQRVGFFPPLTKAGHPRHPLYVGYDVGVHFMGMEATR